MNNNELLNGIIFDESEFMILVQHEEYMLNNPYSRMENLNNNPLTIEALDKVKILNTMPDGYVTTQMVADYFEVPINTILAVVNRNKQELEMNGLITLRGKELSNYLQQQFVNCIMQFTKIRNLTLFNRRVVLNIAMLLRDSLVAKAIRYVILNVLDTDEGRLLLEQENNTLKYELLKQQEINKQLQLNYKLDPRYLTQQTIERLGDENYDLREKLSEAHDKIDILYDYNDSLLDENDRLRKYIELLEQRK